MWCLDGLDHIKCVYRWFSKSRSRKSKLKTLHKTMKLLREVVTWRMVFPKYYCPTSWIGISRCLKSIICAVPLLENYVDTLVTAGFRPARDEDGWTWTKWAYFLLVYIDLRSYTQLECLSGWLYAICTNGFGMINIVIIPYDKNQEGHARESSCHGEGVFAPSGRCGNIDQQIWRVWCATCIQSCYTPMILSCERCRSRKLIQTTFRCAEHPLAKDRPIIMSDGWG